ncbi:EamA family transporter [Brevundimonas sp. A19_0]|uniref:DMT family transporter n=1 Tax=Brevundimonas sp. A19_0 TaxID=2821087 RepID=UPI0032AF7776
MSSPSSPMLGGRWLVAGIAVCALIWGTTWYAITLQLGPVAPTVSVVWRFGLAALVLFAFCLATRRRVRLNRVQHLAALGQGAFVFALSYGFVYASEERVPSAVVAVIFAGLAFVNLVLFRLVAGQKASRLAWAGSALGLLGVAVLSGSEILGSPMTSAAGLGVGMACIAVLSSAVGNYFAWRGQVAGAAVMPATAWAMAYGTAMLALFGLTQGVEWRIEPSFAYIGSLLHLSLMGSVVAFVLYFTIARSRGYGLASYISALTPPTAMLVSVMFEGARFGLPAFAGLALVLAGQVLLIRAPKVS